MGRATTTTRRRKCASAARPSGEVRTCSSAAGAMLRVPAPSGRGPTRALEEDRRVTRGRLPPPRRSRARELPPRSAPPQPRRDSVDQIGASGAADVFGWRCGTRRRCGVSSRILHFYTTDCSLGVSEAPANPSRQKNTKVGRRRPRALFPSRATRVELDRRPGGVPSARRPCVPSCSRATSAP